MLFRSPAVAQFETGNIVGTIKDSTGAVVPGAKVTLTNVGTGVTSEKTTDANGIYKAEVTVRMHDHQMVGIASDADLFTALTAALAKVEKQVLHQAEKWRTVKRRLGSVKSAGASARPVARTANRATADRAANTSPRVFTANHHQRRKPITLEEALLQMEDGRDYLAYRDAEKESVHMLVRRRDGHFDLIES